MNLRRLVVATTIAASACAPVFAEEGANKVYIDVGLTQISAKFLGARFTPKALRLVSGYELSPHLAAEAMLVVGLTESTGVVAPSAVAVETTVKPETSFGVFLKPKAHFGESNRHEVYGRVGYFEANARVTVAAGATSRGVPSSVDSGLSYGFGAKVNLAKDSYLSADYMRYSKGGGVVVDGVTIGMTKHFD